MKRFIRYGIAALSFSVALGSTAQAQSTVKVTDKWFDFSIRWNVGAPTYHAKWYVLVSDSGILQVCGVGAHTGGVKSDNLSILGNLGFFVGDDLVMADMSFFGQTNRRRDLKTASAPCASTGKRASAYSSTEVSLRDIEQGRTYRKGS